MWVSSYNTIFFILTLSHPVGYLNKFTSSDVLTNVVRVLANLALDGAHVKTLQSHKVVSQISHLLSQGDVNVSCKRSIVRALRILCTSSECRDELKQNNGMVALVECMKSEETDLATGALLAIEVATMSGDEDILKHLCDKETMQCVVKVCSHSKDKMKEGALGILLHAIKAKESRVAISIAGGVEMIVTLMESASDKSGPMFQKIVYIVCMCCRDVNCRQRLRECGGLERLITMLAEQEFVAFHENMMSALVFYYFDEVTLTQMVTRMGFLRTLNYQLKRVCERSADVEDQMVEEANDSTSSAQSIEEECVSVEQNADTVSCDHVSYGEESLPSISDSMEFTDEGSQTGNSLEKEGPPSSKKICLDEHRTVDSSVSSSPTLLDSLLSSPSPYKISSCSVERPMDSSICRHAPGVEGQVVMMFSRLSTLKHCLGNLSYPDTLISIFNYFASNLDPSITIFKVFTRILRNLDCFQNCIICLIPSRIRFLQRELNCLSHERKKWSSSEAKTMEFFTSGRKPSFGEMCAELMRLMAINASSLFGQGVLEHLLRRGSKKEKQASCLSLCLEKL